MIKIVSLKPVESIKPGTPSQIAPDGTILNPVPYKAVNVTFDDGVVVQVERPLTMAKIKAARAAAAVSTQTSVDELSVGQDITT